MNIPGKTKPSMMLGKEKKKTVFNKEVIAKNEKKFEEVRNQVTLLLKQTDKNESFYNLRKTVNKSSIPPQEINLKGNDGIKEKIASSTSKKPSRKRKFSRTSNKEYETNNELTSSPLNDNSAPKVFSKKSKIFINESRKNNREQTISNGSVNDLNTTSETESSNKEREPKSKNSSAHDLNTATETDSSCKYISPRKNSKIKSLKKTNGKQTISNGSVNDLNTTNETEFSNKEREPKSKNSSAHDLNTATETDSSCKHISPRRNSKIKSLKKTKKKSKRRKKGRYISEKVQRTLVENLANDYEVKYLTQFDKVYKILNDTAKKKVPKSNHFRSTSVPFWNMYSYLVKQTTNCILRNDWNTLTTLLIALTDAPKRYQSFLLKASLINFISNPASQESDLEQFLKESFSCHSDTDMCKVLTQFFHTVKRDKEVGEQQDEDNNNVETTVNSVASK